MSTAEAPQKKPKGLIGGTVSLLFSLVGWVCLAIVFSIVVELAGILFGLWDTNHATRLLTKERGYIERMDAFPIVALSPVQATDLALTKVDHLTAPFTQTESAYNTRLVWQVLASTINVIKLVTLRLVVSVMSLPGYFLVGTAAAIDGLVARDIRKFTGGHESGWIFHRAKRFVTPSIIGTISLYLLVPFSIPPALVFAPSMLFFGFMLYLTASKFKKYL